MFQTLIVPAIGALLLLGWIASAAWALRPRVHAEAGVDAQVRAASAAGPDDAASAPQPTHPAQQAGAPHAALARARAARGRTRGGLLGALLTVVAAFLVTRLLFELTGWFQLVWVVALVSAAYVVWRVVILWPTGLQQRQLDDLITGHGMKSVGLPWTAIITVIALLALWFVPPLLLF